MNTTMTRPVEEIAEAPAVSVDEAAPEPPAITRPRRVWTPLGPCDKCISGDHVLCTGVACYRCPRENHRQAGVAARTDLDRSTVRFESEPTTKN